MRWPEKCVKRWMRTCPVENRVAMDFKGAEIPHLGKIDNSRKCTRPCSSALQNQEFPSVIDYSSWRGELREPVKGKWALPKGRNRYP